MLLEVLTIGAVIFSPHYKMANGYPLTQVRLADIRAEATKASGARSDDGPWVLAGACTFREADERFELAFGSRFRFRHSVTGPLTAIIGFDGQRCWDLNWSGIAHYVDLGTPVYDELVAWTISGAWALPDSPIVIDRAERTSGDLALAIELPSLKITAKLILDDKTLLPKSLRFTADSGEETWTFDSYRRFASRSVPTVILDRMSGQTDSYTVTSAKRIRDVDTVYNLPTKAPDNSRFDLSTNPTVEIKSLGGYMFVRPKVDGKEAGWFFLDTGAEVMCLDPKFAKALEAKELGHDVTSGVVATVKLAICQTHSFSLGPLTLHGPVFLELDMSQFTKAFGFEISGICGFDFVSHSVLEVNPSESKLTLYPGSDPQLPTNVDWRPIQFSGQLPCTSCEFDGKYSGLFSLDTGSGSTVDFFSPTVTRLDMASKHPTSKAQTGGAGGAADSLTETIDSFLLGGHQFDHPVVGLQTTKTGVFASPYLDGNVGMGFMSHFRIFLDYRRSRIAFIWVK